jgi:hypothetical protein
MNEGADMADGEGSTQLRASSSFTVLSSVCRGCWFSLCRSTRENESVLAQLSQQPRCSRAHGFGTSSIPQKYLGILDLPPLCKPARGAGDLPTN